MRGTGLREMSMGRKPTDDEAAGMAWWNALTEAQREQALRDAGWRPGGADVPSVADAWALHKKRSGGKVVRMAVGDLAKDTDAYFDTFGGDDSDASRTQAFTGPPPLRYIVVLNGNGLPPYVFDTEAKAKIMSYPTVAEAEHQAILLNRLIRPATVRLGL